MYIDAHSHLQFSEYDGDREDVIRRMGDGGVRTFTVGTNYRTSKDALLLAQRHPDIVRAIVGLHPIYASDTYASREEGGTEEFDEEAYTLLVKKGGGIVVGIGECGLDYFHADEGARKAQQRAFRAQLTFALHHNLPLMLHIRPSKGTVDAYEDALRILNESQYREKLRGDVHFFAGSWEIAKRFLALHFSLSFTGVITFVHDYDEVVKNTPMEYILSETDAPYVSPVPYRGKRNEPLFVKEIVQRIAELKNLPTEKVVKQIEENVNTLFHPHFS